MEYTSVSPVQRTSRTRAYGLVALAVLGALVASYAIFNILPTKTELAKLDLDDVQDVVEGYKQWKKNFRRSFGTLEDTKRFNIYSLRDKKIKEFNKKRHAFKLGHNKFSDLTEEEFLASYTGLDPNLMKKNKTTRPKAASRSFAGVTTTYTTIITKSTATTYYSTWSTATTSWGTPTTYWSTATTSWGTTTTYWSTATTSWGTPTTYWSTATTS